MVALGCVCICGGTVARDSSDAKQVNGLHNEAKVSKEELEGVGSATVGTCKYYPCICNVGCSILNPATQFIVSDCRVMRGNIGFIEENSLSHLCIHFVDAKSLVLESRTRVICIVV